MRAAFVSVVLPFLLTTEAAASNCLSRAEARSVFGSRTHLYWSVGPNGQCWANSLRAARAMAKAVPVPTVRGPDLKSEPEPLLPVPVALPGLMPPHQDAPVLEENARWSWINEARAAERDLVPEIVYSTFDGEPPDVWPVLPASPAPTTSGGIFIVVLSAVLSMVFGMAFVRWHLRRLRWRR
jgi:hypothetical protein